MHYRQNNTTFRDSSLVYGLCANLVIHMYWAFPEKKRNLPVTDINGKFQGQE